VRLAQGDIQPVCPHALPVYPIRSVTAKRFTYPLIGVTGNTQFDTLHVTIPCMYRVPCWDDEHPMNRVVEA